MSYDLEDPYRTNDWKSTNSHKGELVIAYNNKVGNKTLHPRILYALYIRPNDIGNEYLVYRLSTDQILVKREYQSVHASEDLIEPMSKTNSYDNKIQVILSIIDQAIVQNDYSNNHNKDDHTHINNTNNPEDESHNELNSSSQIYGMEPNKIVDQGYKILLPAGPNKSTSISVNHNGTTNTNTFLHGLFLMYLHKAIIIILCIRLSLTIFMYEDIPYHLYKGIFKVVHILLSLPVSLRNGIIRPSLLTSLQSKFLRLSFTGISNK